VYEQLRWLMRTSLAMPLVGARQTASLVSSLGSAWPAHGLPSPTPRSVLRATVRMIRETADGFSSTLSTEDGAEWQQLANKLEAFELFQFADAALGLPETNDVPLDERLSRAEPFDSYRRLWLVEGLGYAHAEKCRDAADGLLVGEHTDTIPRACLMPLHTGMGLSLARLTLTRGGPPRTTEACRAAVEQFLTLCRRHGRPGYREAALEALGLIARNLAPQSLNLIDRELARIDGSLVAMFWHGAGRGLFFAPTRMLPGTCSLWHSIGETRRDAPHRAGRENALAGLVWASTMVNMRHPRLLRTFVEQHGDQLDPAERGAFAHGVSSAVSLWYDVNGRDRRLVELLGAAARPAGASTGHLWDALVVTPVAEALARHEALAREQRLGSLFSYQPEGDAV